MPTKKLTQQAFGSVALHGPTEFPGRDDAKTGPVEPVRQDQNDHVPAADPPASVENLLELRAAEEPFGTPQALTPGGGAKAHWVLPGGLAAAHRTAASGHCQAFTALGAPAFEHQAAVFRAHPHQEPMGSPAAAAVGLEGPFHGRISFSRAPRGEPGESLILANESAWCQWTAAFRRPPRSIVRTRPVCYSRHPAARLGSPIGSPPEVFHNCGKKCGNSRVSPRRCPRTGARTVSSGHSVFWLVPERSMTGVDLGPGPTAPPGSGSSP